jgi:putative nucleotidyltransferase with HDIG domain
MAVNVDKTDTGTWSSTKPVLPAVLKTQRLRKVHQSLDNLPSMPLVIQRILTILNDRDSNAGDLEKHFRQDPALVAKMLRLVNSALYALRNPIKDITQAAVLLGYNTMRSIVLGAWMGEFLNREVPAYGYAKGGLYQHSLAVAFVAREAGRWLGHDRDCGEELFLCGLLHDIGKLPLAQLAEPKVVFATEPLVVASDILTREEEYFGTHHAEIGAEIAHRWSFPVQLLNAIRHHQEPQTNGDSAFHAAVVHLADWCCNRHSVGISPPRTHWPAPAATGLEILALATEDLDGWLEKSAPVVAQARSLEAQAS